jgi:hypothetical protein
VFVIDVSRGQEIGCGIILAAATSEPADLCLLLGKISWL